MEQYKLTQLLHNQAAHYWPLIKDVIYKSREDTSDETLNDVLANILVGKIQVWAVIENDENYRGMFLTAIRDEDFCIDYFYVNELKPAIWRKAEEIFQKFGQANGCPYLVCLTKLEGLKKMAERYGADVSWHIRYTWTDK